MKSRRRLVRDGINAYLAGRPEFTVVGLTGCIDEVAELCMLRRPDAALVDAVELTRPVVEALRRVRAVAPATEIVITYADAEPEALEAAARADLSALVPCSRGLDTVMRTVWARAHAAGARQPDGRALNEHDLTIMSLLSAGHSVPEMAELLRVSPRTVENHKRRLYLKLGVNSSAQVVSRASALGLIDLPAANGRPPLPEPGRAPLVVVHGPPSDTLGRVLLTLQRASVPVVHTRTPAPLGQEHWARWQRGPVARVLVDPTYDEWAMPPLAGTRTVVVLSVNPPLPTLVDQLLHGAHAVVPGADLDDLESVLSVVLRGYVAIDDAHLGDIAGWMAEQLAGGPLAGPQLSSRELDILASIADGHSIRQTASALGIAAKTVENTQSRMFRKLGVRNRQEALAVADRLGLLETVRVTTHGSPRHDHRISPSTRPQG